jgi:hypothetical protein
MQHDASPRCCIVSRSKQWNKLSSPAAVLSRKSLSSAARWSNSKHTSLDTLLCSSVSSQGSQQQQTLDYPKVFIISYMALCPVQICNTISLTITLWHPVMSPSTSCSLQFMVAVLGWPLPSKINDVPVAIFEVFHPTSHTAGIHAQISTDMTKSVKDVCSRIFTVNLITAHCCNNV